MSQPKPKFSRGDFVWQGSHKLLVRWAFLTWASLPALGSGWHYVCVRPNDDCEEFWGVVPEADLTPVERWESCPGEHRRANPSAGRFFSEHGEYIAYVPDTQWERRVS